MDSPKSVFVQSKPSHHIHKTYMSYDQCLLEHIDWATAALMVGGMLLAMALEVSKGDQQIFSSVFSKINVSLDSSMLYRGLPDSAMAQFPFFPLINTIASLIYPDSTRLN